jgi:hypothetical protein
MQKVLEVKRFADVDVDCCQQRAQPLNAHHVGLVVTNTM